MSIRCLGYLGFEVRDPDAWQGLATDVLGLLPGRRGASGVLWLRMDDWAQRIALQPGPADDLAFAGFEVEDDHALGRLADRLTNEGVNVEEAPAEMAARRAVKRLLLASDPNGVPIELFSGPARTPEPFSSPLVPGGFLTGDEGLGHVVMVARDPEATERFYCELLGMRVSDWVETELAPGLPLRVTFLHCNPRHHTVAFAAAPLPKRIHHFMMELRRMEEVGAAYDRCLDAGVPIASALGQHPNDRMFSFYARTPSGFEVEIGWGGRKVDDAVWETRTYDRLSIWGHRPPAGGGT